MNTICKDLCSWIYILLYANRRVISGQEINTSSDAINGYMSTGKCTWILEKNGASNYEEVNISLFSDLPNGFNLTLR